MKLVQMIVSLFLVVSFNSAYATSEEPVCQYGPCDVQCVVDLEVSNGQNFSFNVFVNKIFFSKFDQMGGFPTLLSIGPTKVRIAASRVNETCKEYMCFNGISVKVNSDPKVIIISSDLSAPINMELPKYGMKVRCTDL